MASSDLKPFTGQLDTPSRNLKPFTGELDPPESPKRTALDVAKDVGITALKGAVGLPQSVVAAGDPYQSHVEATARAVVERLGPGWDWKICYQSRVGPMKWLGPSTLEAILEAAEEGYGVIVTPIAFVSEHIETLVELDHDYATFAAEQNASPYIRVPALGVHARFVQGLAQAVKSALERSEAGRDDIAPGSAWRCGQASGRCPCLQSAHAAARP